MCFQGKGGLSFLGDCYVRGNTLSIFKNDKTGTAVLIQRQLVIVNPIRRKLKSLPQSRFDRKIWDSFSIVSVWCSLLLGSLHVLWIQCTFSRRANWCCRLSVLFSLKVLSPEIMQTLLEIDWQPCHATSEDFPPAVDSWPVSFETRGVFTKRKKPFGKIMYLKHSDNCNDAIFFTKGGYFLTQWNANVILPNIYKFHILSRTLLSTPPKSQSFVLWKIRRGLHWKSFKYIFKFGDQAPAGIAYEIS